jgi:predicted transcriptional regulator
VLIGGPVDASVVAGVMQRDDATGARLLDSLVADGLVERVDATVRLPGG